jgi:hypothetical protein
MSGAEALNIGARGAATITSNVRGYREPIAISIPKKMPRIESGIRRRRDFRRSVIPRRKESQATNPTGVA